MGCASGATPPGRRMPCAQEFNVFLRSHPRHTQEEPNAMFVKSNTTYWRTPQRLLVATLVALVLSTFVGAAFAAPAGPSLTLSPTSGTPGAAILVLGASFPKGVQVALTWDGFTT